MAKGLYIGATSPFAGKSMLTVGMGLHFQKEGLNFGYMKPMGNVSATDEAEALDEDAAFAREVFDLADPAELITPVRVTQDFKMRALSEDGEDQLPVVKRAFDTLAAQKDLVMVGGSGHIFTGKHFGLDGVRVSKELGLKTVIVDRIQQEANYDMLLTIKEQLGDHLLGVVLNDVPQSFIPEVQSVIKPFLERNSISLLGMIQSDPLMRSIRASDLAEHLGGKLVSAQNEANRMVESFLIGTMQVENFMTYFRRQPNAAVIVGGDRADVQLVAIEGECPCIILTGNLYPNDIILARADTLKVPIIMVRGDTYSVAHRMETLLSRYKMRDVKKVNQASQLVGRALNFQAIKSALGLA